MVDASPAVLAAVMVVWPGASAVIMPLSSMVATPSSLDVQCRVLSAASSGRTVACSVQVMPLFKMPPSCSSVTLVGTMGASVGTGVAAAVGAGVAVGAVSGVAASLAVTRCGAARLMVVLQPVSPAPSIQTRMTAAAASLWG